MHTKLWVSAATVALASGALVGAPSPAGATYPGDNGRIMFTQSSDSETTAIVTADPDGSDQVTVVDEGTYLSADWSPGGERIAFAAVVCAGDDCHSEIATMNADGSQVVHLTRGPRCCDVQPAWSPDGRRIAFANDNGGIYVIAATGGAPREITPGVGRGDSSPTWSPDGRWLAFTRTGSGGELGSRVAALFVVRPDGSRLRRVTSWGLDAGSADWSPDGRRLLFAGKGETPAHGAIYTIRADGTQRRTLLQVTGRADFHDPRWSPDSGQVILQGWLDPRQGRRIWVMRADGSRLRELPVGAAGRELEAPTWGTAPTVG